MSILFAQSILSGQVLRAFCWTLVHSCWQGLLLAVLTGLVILITGRSRPAVRYNLLSGMLCLFFLTACVTFALEMRYGDDSAALSLHAGGQSLTVGGDGAGVDTQPDILLSEVSVKDGILQADRGWVSWWEKVMGYFDAHASLIVAIWFVVFMAKLVKIIAHLGAIKRMRHYKVKAAPAIWSERLGELALRLGIRKQVQLLESALIRVPMMAGVFKPVILVPLGLLSQLSPQQVEAILLHELAHVRRKDYLINLVFSCTGIVFFFNPAVLWISALIREERENCCDDMAVGLSRSKKDFISALVSFEEHSHAGMPYTLAFPGSGNYLLKRVKRIMHQDNKVLDIREKCFLLICLLVMGGGMMAFSRQEKRNAVSGTAGFAAVRMDTMPNGSIAAETVDTLSPEARRNALETFRRQQDSLNLQRKQLQEAREKLAGQELALSRQQEALIEEYRQQAFDNAGGGKIIRDSLEVNEMLRLKQGEEDRQLQQLKIMKEMEDQENLHRQEYLKERLAWEKLSRRRQLKEMQQLKEKQMALIKEARKNVFRSMGGEEKEKALMELKQQESKTLKELEEARLINQADTSRDPLILQQLPEENEKSLRLQELTLQKQGLKLQNEQLALQNDELVLHDGGLLLQKEGLVLQNDRLKLKDNGAAFHRALDPIIADLLEKKIISDTEKLSFTLDRKELRVNGVLQPDEVFEYFRKKYIGDSRNIFALLKNGKSEVMTVKKFD